MIRLDLPAPPSRPKGRQALARGVRADIRASFAGAQTSRLTSTWFATLQSADRELQGALPALRERARELGRNNAIVASYLQAVPVNVIGPSGMSWQSRLEGPNGELDEDVNDAIEWAVWNWGRRGTATVDGRQSFCELQDLAFTAWLQDGEVLGRHWRGFDNPYGYAFQLLDPDQLDSSYNVPAGPGRNEIRMGIEVDHWMRPVAYHIWDGHPFDLASRGLRRRVPAEQILHVYRARRPNQSRGIPPLTPVLLLLRMAGIHLEAELTASLISAAKMGWLKKTDESAPDLPVAVDEDADADAGDEGCATERPLTLSAEPGVMQELPFGWDYVGWDPQHPTTAFEPFQRAVLRAIAGALGVSYSTLANDLSDTSYASGRQGLLLERDLYRRIQRWWVEAFCDPILKHVLQMGTLSGTIPVPGENATEVLRRGEWKLRGWRWVDPLKDAAAAEKAIHLGVATRTDLCAEQGGDFAENVKTLAREERIARDAGVDVSGEKAGTAVTVSADDDEDKAPPAPRRRLRAVS